MSSLTVESSLNPSFTPEAFLARAHNLNELSSDIFIPIFSKLLESDSSSFLSFAFTDKYFNKLAFENLSVIHQIYFDKFFSFEPSNEELHFAGKGIMILPTDLEHFTNLKTLDLHSNKIKDVSEKISSLTNLTSLDLSDNKIYRTSDKFSILTNLTILNLSKNNLKEISQAYYNLPMLKTLDFSNNPIEVDKKYNGKTITAENGLQINL